MNKFFLSKLMFVSVIFMAGASTVLVMNDLCYAENTKRKGGLNFQVPEDWPIEKRGGIVAPIPTEEYISIKFKATEEEFQTIKDDLATKFEELQLNMKNMEVSFSKEIEKTRAQADGQLGFGEDLVGMQESLTMLISEVGRLDKKITNKTAVMKSESEETALLIKSFEKKIKTLQAHIKNLGEEIDHVYERQGSAY